MPITSSGFCCLTAHLRQWEGGGKAQGWQEGLSRARDVGRWGDFGCGRWGGMVGEGRRQSATSPQQRAHPSSRRAVMGLPGGGSLLRKAPTPYSALRPSKTHCSRLPSLSQSFLTGCPRARPSPLRRATRPWGLLPGLGQILGQGFTLEKGTSH